MKKLTKDLQEKTIIELEKEAQTLRQEIGKLSIERKVRPEKDTNLIFKKKKQLAVMLTLIQEKRDLEFIGKQ